MVTTRSVSEPLSGDYTQQETRVPIPNTTVKLPGPMIVPTSAKVGYRRDFSTRPESPRGDSGRFLCALINTLPLLLLGLLAQPAGISAAGRAQPGSPAPDASVRRLLDAVPQQRRHHTLLDRARGRLQANDSNNAILILQAILDSPADSFLFDKDRIRSARQVALELLRGHPAAGTRRYRGLYRETAAALLRQAGESEGTKRLELLRTIVRRFRLTDAGFRALNQLATMWLDQGHSELAWRALRMLDSEPSFPGRLARSFQLKFASAARLTGLPSPSSGDSVALALGNLSRQSPVDWPLPFGPARQPRAIDAAAPHLSEAWHTRLSEPGDSSPLIPWATSQWADGRLTGALALYPIVVGDQVVLRDHRGIRGLSLLTGATLWRFASPCTWQMRHRAFDRLVPVVRSGTDRFSMALVGNPRFGMITSDGQRVYGVQLSTPPETLPVPQRPTRARTAPDFAWPSQLVALTIPSPRTSVPPSGISPAWLFPPGSGSPTRSRTGSPTPAPETEPTTVLSPAFPAGGLLFTLIEQRRQIDLVALAPRTGRRLWSQPLVHSDTGLDDVRGVGRHSAACLPSQASGLAICTTGTGVTVAINLVDGTLAWAHDGRGPSRSNGRYRSNRSSLTRPLPGDAGLANLPLVTSGHAILLSPLGDRITSVNLETGRSSWSRGREGIEYVAAASPKTLLVVGPRQVQGLDPLTGRATWQRRPGLVSGRGVRLGQDRYLIPLKSGRITCLEIDTGHEVGLSLPPARQLGGPATDTSEPVGLPASGGLRPGNLIVGGKWILSLTADRITAFPQATPQLSHVRSELLTDPGNDRLRLHAAELTLALGQHDESRKLLDSIVDSDNPVISRRGRRILRELLFLQLAAARTRPASDAGPLLSRLSQLADTPRQSARVLVEEGRWHLDQNDPVSAFESATRLNSLRTRPVDGGITEITADRDGIHVLSHSTWITALSRRALAGAAARDAAADRMLLDRLTRQTAALSKSASLDDQLSFVRRHANNPVADPVRLTVAARLVEIGRFQQAELLLLAIRNHGGPTSRLSATVALISLWSRLGLQDECGPLFEELANGRLADVAGIDGFTGSQWVARRPPDDLAKGIWQTHHHPTPRATRAEITMDTSVAAIAELPRTYQKVRRRFSTSERSTFDLLETYTNSTRRVTLMDRQVGVEAGHIDLPAQFSVPIWWHQSRSGHLLPLGSHSSMLGLSLLERSETRPLWKRTFAPLATRPEMLRVGPSGVLAVTFQSRQHLVACSPIDGELLWRRGDLETGSGSFADAASGFFGDDHVLVVSRGDRISHDVYDTLTGHRRLQARLPITSRTRRRVFGRHLMYVTTEGNGMQRIRVWDPLTNRTVIDEPLKDRIFPVATPDHHLAWIDSDGQLQVHDLVTDTRQLKLEVLGDGDERISSIKVFRDRDCWYIAMLPAQGAVAPRAVNAPVYFVGDTMLPVTHVHGHLLAINADTRTIRWRRTVPLRSVVRFRHDHLPALILLGRTRDRGRGGRQRMLVELLDSKTGRTLLLEDKLSTDRIVLAWYDPRAARLEMQGLKSRITIKFQSD